tara:strand:- start:914 stop:1465 length:552 start_codon:yes stop_codon:yes gene_type:complete
MDYQNYIESRDFVMQMSDNPVNDKERIVTHNRRKAVISAQWAMFSYKLHCYQIAQKKKIKDDPYLFWATSALHRIVLMAVMNAHFKKKKLNIKQTAIDLDYDRSTITTLLNDAQKSGHLINENGCKYKPSFATIDGYAHYTNVTLSSSVMRQLSSSILRLMTGMFSTSVVEKAPPKNRLTLEF